MLLILSFYGIGFGAIGGKTAGFGMLGRPVFGWKSDTPKIGNRGRELQANFGFAGSNGAEKRDVAVLIFLRALVLQIEFGAAGKTSGEEYERAVSVDGQCFGFFVDGFTLSVGAANANRNLHQNALTTPAGAGTYRCVWSVAHTASLISTIRGEWGVSSESGKACSGR
jgi:hypothetical protein